MKIIRHKPLFSENVLLIYNGKRKKMRLTVDLTLGAKNFLKATERLRESAEALDEQNTDQTYKELQEATKALFSLAFGRQSAETIFEFFEGNALEMSSAFTPFIVDVVNPKIEKSALKRAKNER